MKIYRINIQDDFFCVDSKVAVKLVIELKIDKLDFSLQLLGWSNDEQKEIAIEDSFYSTIECYESLNKHYSKICDDYLSYLKTNITTQEKLENFVYELENPKFEFHYKLLNVFSQEQLEKIMKKHFNTDPILNLKDFSHFLPNVTNGWYGCGIEVSTDLDDNDYPLIEDDKGIITPEKLLKKYKIKT